MLDHFVMSIVLWMQQMAQCEFQSGPPHNGPGMYQTGQLLAYLSYLSAVVVHELNPPFQHQATCKGTKFNGTETLMEGM